MCLLPGISGCLNPWSLLYKHINSYLSGICGQLIKSCRPLWFSLRLKHHVKPHATLVVCCLPPVVLGSLADGATGLSLVVTRIANWTDNVPNQVRCCPSDCEGAGCIAYSILYWLLCQQYQGTSGTALGKTATVYWAQFFTVLSLSLVVPMDKNFGFGQNPGYSNSWFYSFGQLGK